MPPTNPPSTPDQPGSPAPSGMGHHHLAMLLSLIAVGIAGFTLVTVSSAGTIVPGHQKQIESGRIDANNNGYPDEGIAVTGKYTSLYAYDDNGKWYWDLGDGRVQGNVPSVDDLDQDTLTTCDYQVEYRGEFGDTPFLDNGWITNNINCKGYDDNGHYNYFIVHETDPRYRGNPDWSVWGTWEYHGLTESGVGNLVRPMTPVGSN